MTAAYDAIVIAGGRARRLGGADKPALTVGGRPLLDRVLGACADASRTVVVGPRRPTARPVVWTREEPPGSGPLAALAAGLRRTEQPAVLVLSADLPFLTTTTVRSLLDALDALNGQWGSGGRHGLGRPAEPGGAGRRPCPDALAEQGPDGDGSGDGSGDGALVNDGRDQPLLGAYRTESLRRELALLAAEHGGLGGLPLRLLTEELALRRVASPDAVDCDTWEELAAARARIREHGTVLDEWIAAVKAELGIDLDVDTATLLDLARDAAHGVARPAAPLTTFLVGYVAGRRGGSPEEVAEAAAKAARLALRWQAEMDGQTQEQAGEEAAGAADTGRVDRPE